MKNKSYKKIRFKALNDVCRLCSDINVFFINKPEINTLIKLNSPGEREKYSSSILQRIHIKVNDYSVLNLNRIGIEAPPQFIYDELLLWDGHSEFWPNQLARVFKINDALENILIFIFGVQRIKIPWFRPIKINLPPLFNLTAIKFQGIPPASEMDSARYLLYNCSGGYPIGIFCLYVRRPIAALNEKEKTQLFSLVAFNFYGKKTWFYNYILNKIWEKIHNRISANILNRMKAAFEKKFEEHLKETSVIDVH